MATVIDKLLVEIGVDNKGLKKGVKDTENQVKKIGKTETDLADKKKKRQNEHLKSLKNENKELSAIGNTLGNIGKGIAAYATVTKAISIAKVLGSDAASMQRLSTSMNLAPDKLKKYSNMLEAIGGNGDDALSSLKGLQTALSELKVNGVFGEKLYTLSRLNVALIDEKSGKRKDATQLFEESRIKLNAIPDADDRAIFAEQLGYGSDTQSMMAKTDEEWRKLSEDADVSIALYKENAKAMQEVNQQLHTFGIKLETVSTQILGKIIDSPAFKAVIGWIETAPKNADEIGNNPTGDVTGTTGLIGAIGSGVVKGVGEGVENSELYNDAKTELSSNSLSKGLRMRHLRMQGGIDKAADKYGISGDVLYSLIKEESGGFDVTNKSGAAGIAQFMPGTAKQYGVDVHNAESSEQGAAHYLHDLLNMFGGDYKKALAGYNWGQENVKKAIDAKGKDWLSLAPDETKNYVNSISQSLPRDKVSDKASGTQINVDNVTINTQSSDAKGIKREFGGKMSALAEGGMR